MIYYKKILESVIEIGAQILIRSSEEKKNKCHWLDWRGVIHSMLCRMKNILINNLKQIVETMQKPFALQALIDTLEDKEIYKEVEKIFEFR